MKAIIPVTNITMDVSGKKNDFLTPTSKNEVNEGGNRVPE